MAFPTDKGWNYIGSTLDPNYPFAAVKMNGYHAQLAWFADPYLFKFTTLMLRVHCKNLLIEGFEGWSFQIWPQDGAEIEVTLAAWSAPKLANDPSSPTLLYPPRGTNVARGRGRFAPEMSSVVDGFAYPHDQDNTFNVQAYAGKGGNLLPQPTLVADAIFGSAAAFGALEFTATVQVVKASDPGLKLLMNKNVKFTADFEYALFGYMPY